MVINIFEKLNLNWFFFYKRNKCYLEEREKMFEGFSYCWFFYSGVELGDLVDVGLSF